MISKDDIQKLADLARIEVSEKEIEGLQEDLERILAYVEQLNRAETSDVEPLAHVIGIENVMRRDAPGESVVASDAAELLEAAPVTEKGFLKVRSVWNK